MHERDPVDLSKEKFHHKDQTAISQKIHDGIIRKESIIKLSNTNKEFIDLVTGEEEISDLQRDKKEPVDSSNLLLIEGLIENRSCNIMEQDGKAHWHMFI